jgi:TRAP-type C4-dicarboxylate transport system permease large subunit
MIFFMFVGALAFSQLLAMTGVLGKFTTLVLSLQVSPMVMFALMQLILFIFNCFMDCLPSLLITVPFFMPVVIGMNMDPLWFGVIYLINSVLGMITPPVGMVLFTAMGMMPDMKASDVYQAAIPFVILTVIGIIIMVIFPEICTWLPRLIKL